MKPHVVFMNRYYYPDITSVPQLLTELTLDLARMGFAISVICSRNSYNGNTRYGRFEDLEGIRIHRVWNVYGRNRNLFLRALELVTFSVGAFLAGLRIRKPDVIVVLSSPPFLAALGVILARLRSARTLYVIQDVHPDVGVALGLLREGSPLVRLAEFLNKKVAGSVESIVVLGESMRARVVAKYPSASSKVTLIPNWADGEKIYPIRDKRKTLARDWNLDGKFLV